MTTKPTEAHDATPATEPLALRLSEGLGPTPLPTPAGFRTRYRSEPGMIGHYPWTYADQGRRRTERPSCEYEDLFTAEQMQAYAEACVVAATTECSAYWRDLAQRVAHQGNSRGLEGLKVRCSISEAGSLVSWEVDRTGEPRCDGCGNTIATHDRLLRCCGPNSI